MPNSPQTNAVEIERRLALRERLWWGFFALLALGWGGLIIYAVTS